MAKTNTVAAQEWAELAKEAKVSMAREQFEPTIELDGANDYVLLEGMFPDQMAKIMQFEADGKTPKLNEDGTEAFIAYPEVIVAELVGKDINNIRFHKIPASRLGNKIKNIETGKFTFILTNLQDLANDQELSTSPLELIVKMVANGGVQMSSDEIITTNNKFKGDYQQLLWDGIVPVKATVDAVKKAFKAYNV